MKLLAFVDVHASHKMLKALKQKVKKEKPDILLCAGDISIFEHGIEHSLSFLNRLNKPVVIIPGNHEDESLMRKQCKKFRNLNYIHKRKYKKNGLLVLGYGSGGFALNDPEFRKLSKKFARALGWNKNKKKILLIHGPPYGTKLDKIIGQHAGNKDITKFIKHHDLDYVICGHLHENFGKKDRIGKTILLNPGPKGMVIEL